MDSRDRITGTQCDFRIQLPQTLVLPPGHRARIDNLRVPQVFPTVQAGVNDTIVIRIGTNHTVTIAQGNYTGPGLATAIQTALNQQVGGGSNWTCSYDVANISMAMTCLTSNFVIVGGTRRTSSCPTPTPTQTIATSSPT